MSQMLVCMILMFLLSQVPLATLRIIYEFDPHLRFNDLIFMTQLVVNVLSSIYSSANFILFVCFDDKFRSIVQQSFRQRSLSSASRSRSHTLQSQNRNSSIRSSIIHAGSNGLATRV